jgi:hypothetical protein
MVTNLQTKCSKQNAIDQSIARRHLNRPSELNSRPVRSNFGRTHDRADLVDGEEVGGTGRGGQRDRHVRWRVHESEVAHANDDELPWYIYSSEWTKCVLFC